MNISGRAPARDRAGADASPEPPRPPRRMRLAALLAAVVALATAGLEFTAWRASSASAVQVALDRPPAWAVAAVGNGPGARHWWSGCASYPITPVAAQMDGHAASGVVVEGNCATIFFDFPGQHPPLITHHGVVVLRTRSGEREEPF